MAKKKCRVDGCETLTSGQEGYCNKHRDLAVYRRYKVLKDSARRKGGLEFDITLSEYEKLVEPHSCYYCKGPLNKTGHNLDRLDNTRGYTKDNVVPCCSKCNTLKGERFQPEQTLLLVDFIQQMNYNNWVWPKKWAKLTTKKERKKNGI